MNHDDYHIHVSSKHNLFDLKLKEVWSYRELALLFTKRKFTVSYKQTILGPLWLFITPLMTSIFHMILFGNIAKLGTDGVPQLLFYLSSNAIWSYFSTCVGNNASTFTGNAGLFGKVYFPRLIIPISNIMSAIIRFGIQMIIVVVLMVYYVARGMVHPHPYVILALPIILVWLGVMGMGFGIIISSMTTKYRDLSILVDFGLGLWMYATPIVYTLSKVNGTLRTLILLNPVTALVELYRDSLLGVGSVQPGYLIGSGIITIVVVVAGVILFNKVERTFMDTV